MSKAMIKAHINTSRSVFFLKKCSQNNASIFYLLKPKRDLHDFIEVCAYRLKIRTYLSLSSGRIPKTRHEVPVILRMEMSPLYEA